MKLQCCQQHSAKGGLLRVLDRLWLTLITLMGVMCAALCDCNSTHLVHARHDLGMP